MYVVVVVAYYHQLSPCFLLLVDHYYYYYTHITPHTVIILHALTTIIGKKLLSTQDRHYHRQRCTHALETGSTRKPGRLCNAIMSGEIFDDLLQLSDSDDEIEYEEEEVHVAGKTFSIKSLPEQIPVEILAKLSSANVEISGRCPWPGSLLLATYLNKAEYGKSLILGRSVVELGTGCGILGFAIADLVSKLLLTDNDRFALSLVQKNIEQNFLEKDPPSVAKLAWGDDADLAKYDSVLGAYDVVVAADVCYKEDIVNPLFVTAATLSKKHFVLCHIPRGTTNGGDNDMVTNAMVCKYAEQNGFLIEKKMQVDEDLLSISPKECAQGVGCKDAVIYVWIKKEK